MLKKNDSVIVIAGKDKGKTGEVRKVLAAENKVIVGGINMVAKHQKPAGNKKGGIVKKEAPLHISNVAVVCKKCKKAMTPKINISDKGVKTRVCRKCGEPVK